MNFKEKFNSNGYLIKKDFFSPAVIKKICEEIIDNNASVSKHLKKLAEIEGFDHKSFAIEGKNIKYLAGANSYFKEINKLLTSKVTKYAEEILDDEVYLDAIELHQKMKGTTHTPPHQDNFYFCLEEWKSLTAYIPLNKQSESNGALAVIPKSHLIDFDHHQSDVVGFSSGINKEDLLDFEVDNYELDAGDISFHHCNIVHLAPPNISGEPRTSIALRFKGVSDNICQRKLERYKKFANQSKRIS